MPFLPKTFEVPPAPATDEFLLTPLRVDHVVLDFEAVMVSRQRLWALFGEPWGWPRADLSLMQDLIDLGWHQKEFQLRRAFAWAVLAPDERTVLGCCYVDPPEADDPDGADAVAWYWVRSDRIESGLEERVGAVFRDWLQARWPFQRVAFPGRDQPR